jgi:hypothetical protein
MTVTLLHDATIPTLDNHDRTIELGHVARTRRTVGEGVHDGPMRINRRIDRSERLIAPRPHQRSHAFTVAHPAAYAGRNPPDRASDRLASLGSFGIASFPKMKKGGAWLRQQK